MEYVFRNQESGIRNQDIFIFNTTKAFGQVNSTCLQNNIHHIQGIKAIYHDNQVEIYIYIYLIGSCINKRNAQQGYVNSVMTNGNKPILRHINAPVHIINTVRLA